MLVTLMNISELRVVAFRMMRAVMIRQEIWSRRYVSTVAYASRILLFASSFDLVLSGTSRSPFIAVNNCSSTMHSKWHLITRSLFKIRSWFTFTHSSHNLCWVITSVPWRDRTSKHRKAIPLQKRKNSRNRNKNNKHGDHSNDSGCLQRNHDERIHQLPIERKGQWVHDSRSDSNLEWETKGIVTEKTKYQENTLLLGLIAEKESIDGSRGWRMFIRRHNRIRRLLPFFWGFGQFYLFLYTRNAR